MSDEFVISILVAATLFILFFRLIETYPKLGYVQCQMGWGIRRTTQCLSVLFIPLCFAGRTHSLRLKKLGGGGGPRAGRTTAPADCNTIPTIPEIDSRQSRNGRTWCAATPFYTSISFSPIRKWQQLNCVVGKKNIKTRGMSSFIADDPCHRECCYTQTRAVLLLCADQKSRE